VISLKDLDPQANGSTALADVNGTRNQGVQPGSIIVNIDGQELVVDLTNAVTLGDVATRVNAAIAQIDPTAGALSISGSGFALSAAAGHTLEIDDIGTGVTALDLGIAISATGTTVAGGDIDPRITQLTQLSDLGVAIDFSGGLKITQGGSTAVADFSAAVTVQDLMKEIQRLNLGLRMEINADGTAVDLVSEVSGINLSIAENGGTTAEDLGLRTFGLGTSLSDFRHGLGVQTSAGDDFAIQLRDGRSFQVDVSGAGTVQDVLDRIRNAATAAGLSVGDVGDAGTDFNLGLRTNANGFQFEDGTTGGYDFRVTQLGESLAATHLGIYPGSTGGSTLQGTDTAQVRVESVFTHLINLRDSLLNDDSSGITLAGTAIERDVDNLTRARADVGVRAKRAEQQTERSKELGIAEQSLLSEIADADLTQVITRFTQLQQQLTASFQTAAQQLQLSLLDFLR
jgi:flagellar hook-associated protein 3 FlgL